MPRLERAQIAARVAQDIPDKAYVNLGIGVPTLVSDYLPSDRHIVLHTENGMLGMGHAAAEDEIDLTAIHTELTKIATAIQSATSKHNEFLRALGMPLLPTGNADSPRS